MPQVTFSLIDRDSSWDRLLMMVISSSDLLSKEERDSFSNLTSTPFAFSYLIVEMESRTFLEKRDRLFVRISENFPSSASLTMF